MKRVMNEVALQTLLYVVGGLEKIRIKDYANSYAAMMDGKHSIVYEGLMKDSSRALLHKHEYARVRGIDVKDGVLEIGICTAYEQY